MVIFLRQMRLIQRRVESYPREWRNLKQHLILYVETGFLISILRISNKTLFLELVSYSFFIIYKTTCKAVAMDYLSAQKGKQSYMF